MSSAGHIFEMINKLKELRAIRTSQNSNYGKIKQQYGYHLMKLKIDPNKKNLSNKEIEIIKEKIRTKMLRERVLRNLIVAVITAAVALFLFYLIDLKLTIL